MHQCHFHPPFKRQTEAITEPTTTKNHSHPPCHVLHIIFIRFYAGTQILVLFFFFRCKLMKIYFENFIDGS